METLDIGDHQVLIDFPEDSGGYVWHHRILFIQGEGAQWVAGTPDEDICQVDLSEHRVLPLGRSTPFPSSRAAQTYAFDPDTSDVALSRMRAQAVSLAKVVGYPSAATGGSIASDLGLWRLSDPARDDFTDVVPDAAMVDDRVTVIRGGVALVDVDGTWTTSERVGSSELENWVRAKRRRAGEMIIRKLIQVEQAVRISPRQPD